MCVFTRLAGSGSTPSRRDLVKTLTSVRKAKIYGVASPSANPSIKKGTPTRRSPAVPSPAKVVRILYVEVMTVDYGGDWDPCRLSAVCAEVLPKHRQHRAVTPAVPPTARLKQANAVGASDSVPSVRDDTPPLTLCACVW